MAINSVSISGNLTRDPEIRQTASGMSVLSFGVAVNDRRKNQQTGEWEDVPNYIDCTMFGNRAESVSRYLAKGSKVAIQGRLHWSQWETNGQKRSKVDVIVNEIVLMSQQQQAYQQPQPMPQAQPYQAPQAYQQPAPQPYQQAPQLDALYEEDVPF